MASQEKQLILNRTSVVLVLEVDTYPKEWSGDNVYSQPVNMFAFKINYLSKHIGTQFRQVCPGLQL